MLHHCIGLTESFLEDINFFFSVIFKYLKTVKRCLFLKELVYTIISETMLFILSARNMCS